MDESGLNCLDRASACLRREYSDDWFHGSILVTALLACLGFFLSAFVAPDTPKHQMQFNVLFVSYILLASGFVLSLNSISKVLFCLKKIKLFKTALIVTLIWLLGMLFVHGAKSSNLEGFNSGLLSLLLLPIFASLGISFSSDSSDSSDSSGFLGRKRFYLVALFCSGFLVFSENVFLVFHYFYGLNPSEIYMSLEYLDGFPQIPWNFLPRMALNVREGNILALACGCFVYLSAPLFSGQANIFQLVIRAKSRVFSLNMLVLCVLTMAYLNVFLTHGRAIFLALTLPALLSVFCGRLSLSRLDRAVVNYIPSLFGVSAFCGLSLFWVVRFFTFASGGLKLSRPIFNSSNERLLIWKEWLSQGFLDSPLIGQGFNFYPVPLGFSRGLSSAHNIVVQILSDAGMIGLCIACLWFGLVLVFLRRYSMYLVGPFCASCSLFIFAFFSSLFVRPVGFFFLPFYVVGLFAWVDMSRFAGDSAEASGWGVQYFSWKERLGTLLVLLLIGQFFFASKA